MPNNILQIMFKGRDERTLADALTLHKWLISISASSKEFKVFYQLSKVFK